MLLCFCAHLNDAAKLSWPSVARVARLCGMGERTVQNHIRALERAGILVDRLRRTGRAMRLRWTGCSPCLALRGPGVAGFALCGGEPRCGWAHAAIEKHRAVLLDACAALKLKPSRL